MRFALNVYVTELSKKYPSLHEESSNLTTEKIINALLLISSIANPGLATESLKDYFLGLALKCKLNMKECGFTEEGLINYYAEGEGVSSSDGEIEEGEPAAAAAAAAAEYCLGECAPHNDSATH